MANKMSVVVKDPRYKDVEVLRAELEIGSQDHALLRVFYRFLEAYWQNPPWSRNDRGAAS